ncbi:OmpA family protein [Arcobacter arenosus]|uniref:OmpA family protein n=1 Tax=Arcobacter arenosus TaxID=2576037 RepID=UPI003BA9D14C
MSSERKVIILFLLLIVFIVGCVYNHLPEMMKKQQELQSEPKQEVLSDNNKEQEQILVDEKPKDLEEPVIHQDETLVEPNETTKEDTPTVEDTTVETQDVVEKEEEIIEEPKEPLIKTHKDYIREGNEKRIEELSFPTQELQLQINEYIDNNPISFKRGKYTIANNKSVDSIKEIVRILKENPNIKLEIAGHTDAAGSKDVNLIFSLERAKTVVKVMENLGIDENRIKARGYGEGIPKNAQNVYSPENRRVEFNIVEE